MDHALAKAQKEFLLCPKKDKVCSYEDWKEVSFSYTLEDKICGEDLLQAGKVACILLAGGQGSRLGVPLKGASCITLFQKKSLFQIFCEKIFFASQKYGHPLSLIVMTSSHNHEETVALFQKNNRFGLRETQVFFSMQENLPICDTEGNWIVDEKGNVLQGPDGNGRALHQLYHLGIVDALLEKKVMYLQMIPIDNPLADPFDAGFIGFHHRRQAEVSAIAIQKKLPQEQAGVLAAKQGQLCVIEYTEKVEGTFSFLNTGLYCFSLPFVERLGKENLSLPWHVAYKKVKDNQYGWKFEYFIFDVFVYASRFAVLVQPREDCFSPLKNSEGEKSASTVQQDFLQKDRRKYREFAGAFPSKEIELSLHFYYSTPLEEKTWKNSLWPNYGYITPSTLQQNK